MLSAAKIPSAPQTGKTVVPIGIEIGPTTTINDSTRYNSYMFPFNHNYGIKSNDNI
jgi:hypothetical protein